MASTMQLEFAQAMSDFKTMFPDMDRDVIEAVLRANQGAVDATIDQLLAMSTDNQNEKLRNELDSPVHKTNTNTITATQQTNTILSSSPMPMPTPERRTSLLSTSPNILSSVNTGASPKIKKTISSTNSPVPSPMRTGDMVKLNKKWDPPLLGPLPPTFLRIALPEHAVRVDTDLPDEQFAMMLQNEEFMNELRWNQEFMSSLEKEHGKERPDDDAAFKERLRYMGKKSRKKFMQLARVFTWQRNKKPSSVKHDPPPDSLLLQEDYDEDDIDHPKHQQAIHHHGGKK